jgi:hypothetical protein
VARFSGDAGCAPPPPMVYVCDWRFYARGDTGRGRPVLTAHVPVRECRAGWRRASKPPSPFFVRGRIHAWFSKIKRMFQVTHASDMTRRVCHLLAAVISIWERCWPAIGAVRVRVEIMGSQMQNRREFSVSPSPAPVFTSVMGSACDRSARRGRSSTHWAGRRCSSCSTPMVAAGWASPSSPRCCARLGVLSLGRRGPARTRPLAEIPLQIFPCAVGAVGANQQTPRCGVCVAPLGGGGADRLDAGLRHPQALPLRG